MAEVKFVMGDKSGRCYQKIIDSPENLLGRKIGESIKGEIVGVSGYEFLITGGSDDAGFPMRKNIKSRRARILAHSGVGLRVREKGKYIRKTVAGDTIHEKTHQVNVKVIKEGAKKLNELFEAKDQKEQKPKEQKKEAKETKPDEKQNKS